MRRIMYTCSWLIATLLCGLVSQAQTTHVVSNSGLNFVPANLTITAGDTVDWQISSSHNVREVSQATYNANGTASNGGFQLGSGGGKQAFPNPGTFYYVCTPHASSGMKGIVTVNSANAETFVAQLRGIQEVPAATTLGTGEITALFEDDTLRVSGAFDNLSSDYDPNIGAHIHLGYAGSNGPVRLVLTPVLDADNRGGRFNASDNTFALPTSVVDSLQNRQLYVNIHTEAYPGGEIRGQIVPQADDYFFSPLYGSNEVPRVYSQGLGAAMIELRDDTIVVTGSFSGLTGDFDGNPAGGAHLHDALPGANSGIAQGLDVTPDGDLKGGVMDATDNTYELDMATLMTLQARGLYVNIHSTAHPSGELRGQVHGMAQAIFRAALAGANEVPAASVLGGGQVLGEVMNDTLRVVGTFRGLEHDYASNIGSHLHIGYAGQNGPVAIALTPALDGDNRGGQYLAADNAYPLNGTQADLLLERQIYLNVHSVGFPGGELRGQMLPTAQSYFNAYTAGGQEATPVLSRGYGHLIGEFSGGTVTVSGSFAGLESDFDTSIGSHLHKGFYGRNGGVEVFLAPDLAGDLRSAVYAPDSNQFALRDGLVDTLLMRGIYVNIHSTDVPSGELRGQMLPEAPAYFFTPLSGTNEVPPVVTGATGAVALELYAAGGNTMGILSGSFDDLESDFATNIGAHIHGNLPGRNAGVLVALDYELEADNRGAIFMADSNMIPMTTGLTDSLRSGYFYVNVHSTDINSGEVRGNLRQQGRAYLTSTLRGINEVDPVETSGEGALALTLIDTTLQIIGSFNNLEGDFDATVAGGSHFHFGQAYENAGLFQALRPDVAGDLKAGVYVADSNRYALTDTQRLALLQDGIYFNLHSTIAPMGEIRGQILPETNFFPMGAPMIDAPMSGASLTIEGDPSTAFQATWTESMDDDTLVYIWQLSPDPAFGTLLVNSNVGTEAAFTTDFATVDGLLSGAGLAVGDNITLYHRAIASDGAVQTIGMMDSVVLTRGMLTTSVPTPQTGLTLSAAPTRVQDDLRLRIDSDQPRSTTLRLMNLQGQVQLRTSLRLIEGRQHHTLNLRDLSAGVYLLRLEADDTQQTLRVIKE